MIRRTFIALALIVLTWGIAGNCDAKGHFDGCDKMRGEYRVLCWNMQAFKLEWTNRREK